MSANFWYPGHAFESSLGPSLKKPWKITDGWWMEVVTMLVTA